MILLLRVLFTTLVLCLFFPLSEHPPSHQSNMIGTLKNVVVVGGSYVGIVIAVLLPRR